MGTPIGELNGKWALLLKINLMLMPILITAGIALTTFLVTGHWEQNERIALMEYRLEVDEADLHKVITKIEDLPRLVLSYIRGEGLHNSPD